MDDRVLTSVLERFLREDVGSGDVTSDFTPNQEVDAIIKSHNSGYVSGIRELELLFRNHGVNVRSHVRDGGRIRRRQKIMTLKGRSRDILTTERTALNVLSRMSGVTTLTRQYVESLKKSGSKAKVVATRKTTPGMRYFEKTAVVLGGGLPHRMGLYDMILIKDNHLRLFGNDVKAALAAARKSRGKAKVEVEVSSLRDAVTAAENGADIIMLDNMTPRNIRKVVARLKKNGLRGKVVIEASGGVSLRNIRHYGRAGVDWISVGRLTHSVPSIDFSLDVLRL
ncbi:MAG: carboxylating nicotinate-nucleotide diphosphorylase [Candidatus Altiarchaeales archaeon]|nr:carboxylating nicotinate-nucleotide diphosphorylase [Candidatus Altiarchaeales archaeon]MBD3416765.1 carboxylating nicotinate-nucleotide diphosphorylase [Candidatus Altiarchaeales archaeon]